MKTEHPTKASIILLVTLTFSLPFLGDCSRVRTPEDNVSALITKDGLKNIQTALELYKSEFGEYPETLEELLIKKGITRKDIIEDAWNRKYYYLKIDDGYTLFSAGKDKKYHTKDDIYPPD